MAQGANRLAARTVFVTASVFLAATLGVTATNDQPAWGHLASGNPKPVAHQQAGPALGGHAAHRIQIIAHRGGETATPESTLPAFANSIAAGVDGIVFDIRLTRDGVPVVLHDDTLNRTTDCRGPVEDQTAAKVRRCNAAAHFPRFGFQHVPTFDEALKFITAKSRTMPLLVHAKELRNRDDAQVIMAVMRRYGLADNSRATMIADNDSILYRLRAAGARRLGLVFHDSDKAEALNGPWKVLYGWDVHLTRADVETAAKRGKLLIGSQDHPQSLEELLALDVPAIAADDIARTLDRLGRGPSPAAGAVTFSSPPAGGPQSG